MAYLALARKWRPKAFSEVVGQKHVVQALSNALDSGRVHHAFLFTGTRGVGKTTLARIFAKSLNCEQGTSAEPCQVCSVCTSIDEGRFVDLIEVDAASRTKVDDTRELLENVHYAPTVGRFKVFLIDEVHMLSTHSFNALLKTLEEPPEHVKFLFATTDPQKLPVTILSRCLQFNLRAMRPEQIENQMNKILAEENLEFEQAALRLLSVAADGSMRDGLSLLDQAIAQGSGSVSAGNVASMLGTIKAEHTQALLSAVVQQDVDAALSVVNEMADDAVDFTTALDEVLMALYEISLAQLTQKFEDSDLLSADALKQHAEKISAEQVQLFYQIGLISKRDLPLAPTLRVGFEMALLRMFAFEPAENGSLGSASGAEAPANANPASSRAAQNQASPIETALPSSAPASAAPASMAKEQGAPQSLTQALQMTQEQGASAAPKPAETTERVPPTASAAPNAPSPEAQTPQTAVRPAPPEVKPAPQPAVRPAPMPAPQAAPNQAQQTPDENQGEPAPSKIAVALAGNNEWGEVIEQTQLSGLTKELAMNCASERMTPEKIQLSLSPKMAQMFSDERLAEIQQAVQAATNSSLVVQIDIEESERETPAECLTRLGFEQAEELKKTMHNDPGVQALVSEFNAKVVDDSIKPAE